MRSCIFCINWNVLKSIITASKSPKHIWNKLRLQYFITCWALISQIIQSAPIYGFNYCSSDNIRKGSCSVQVLCYYSRDLFLITELLIYGTMSNPFPQMANLNIKKPVQPRGPTAVLCKLFPRLLRNAFRGCYRRWWGQKWQPSSLPLIYFIYWYMWLQRKGWQGEGGHFSIV